MDKTNIVNTFTELVDQLRNTECSQKEKISCFQRIAECIISPAMVAHLNYATYCSKAVNILLLFCEDLDSVVHISAEENLNKIFRVLEKTRVSRILMDLYGEIKRNGNQRSLRICLRIFGYYAPQIREHNVLWYAQNLLPCMKVISKRKETLLQETLSEFVVKFGRHIQQGLTDSETCKLFEVFIENIGSECAVKRRCTAQNCINLIEHACNKSLMAKYALNKVIDILLSDHQSNTIIGILGFLRQLVVIIIKGFSQDSNDNEDSYSAHKTSNYSYSEEARQMLEIYDYCLYLVSSSPLTQHSIINAALEVINSMLQSLEGLTSRNKKNNPQLAQLLMQLMNDKNLKHVNYLRHRDTLKHQIFNLQCFEDDVEKLRNQMATNQDITSQTSSDIILQPQQMTSKTATTTAAAGTTTTLLSSQQLKRHTARSISECVDIDYVDEQQQHQVDDNNADDNQDDDDDEEEDFTTLSEMNESQHTHASSSLLTTANIDLTTKTSSLGLINETISGHGMMTMMKMPEMERRKEAETIGIDAQNLLVNFSSSSDDEKSNQLYNTDNESVNSIEFKAEISRGLVVEGIGGEGTTHSSSKDGTRNDGNNSNTKSNSNNDALTSFFNNFNAASESVTKLFRPSTSLQTKTVTSVVTATSNSTPQTLDSVSLVSNVSSLKRTDTEIIEVIDESSPDTSKTFPTPSTAIMGEIRSLDSADALSTKDIKSKVMEEKRDTPKRISKNPFLRSGSPFRQHSDIIPLQLNIDIGSIYEQSLIYYTARLISARFLLTGCQKGLYDDTTIRVSIKSVCLNVISQCVRLSPEILEISLKFMASEKPEHKEIIVDKPLDLSESNSPLQIPSDTSSNIGQDYEHLDVAGGMVDFQEVKRKSSFTQIDVFRMDDKEDPLLEIIDDYFGKSATDFNFTQTSSSSASSAKPMTRSADPVLFTKPEDRIKKSPLFKTKRDKLSTSEIIATDSKLKDFVEITKAEEDMPPLDMAPPRPPKRTKTFRKSKRERDFLIAANFTQYHQSDALQFLSDILFYYNHEDPILRAGVQIIIGHYCRATQAGLVMDSNINLQYLLAILCMGLQDEIHTVVIQALNTFDKIFPYVMFKYMTTSSSSSSSSPTCHHYYGQQKVQTSNGSKQHQPNSSKKEKSCKNAFSLNKMSMGKHAADTDGTVPTTQNTSTNFKCISGHFNDNDEIIVALLKSFQLQTNNNNNAGSQVSTQNDADPNNINMARYDDGGGMDDDGKIDVPLSTQQQNNVHTHKCYCCASSTTYTSSGCGGTSSASVSSFSHCCGNLLFISPKLLLNKLRLCHYNKYWLVQNKYAEVISNLNYASLRSYYGNNYTNSNNSSSNIYSNNRCCSCSSSTSCHSCPCSCCCCTSHGNFLNGQHVDDVDNADFVCNLENSFIDELLQLIGEDDVRVRENASKSLCRFILQNARKPSQALPPKEKPQRKVCSFDYSQDEKDVLHKTYKQNLKLLVNFFDYSIFNDMSPALRYIFNSRQDHQQQQQNQDILLNLDNIMMGSSSIAAASSSSSTATSSFNIDLPKRAEIEAILAKVLYRLTNRLMSLKDKNMQFGIIYGIKYLLKYFPFADYSCAWTEFNFMEIFVKLSQYNYNTAVDLTCQSDLIDVSSKLIVGSLIFQPDVQQNRDTNLVLLKHTIKIINIYYHIFTNQKPLIMAKSQKVDLFSNAKELAITQSIGYFGNDQVYIKLYQTLKSAYDNYKITINEEAGSKLISLLKTCLNSLSVCIEMLPHEATAAMKATTTAGSSSSGGAGGSNVAIAKSATDVNTVLFSNAMPTGGAATAAAAAGGQGSTSECILVLKLIEEILHYLTKVINYAPEESIVCLRQLLKYLFARNYGNRQQQQQKPNQLQNLKQGHYPKFIKSYFKAKSKELQCISKEDGYSTTSTTTPSYQKQQTNQPPSPSSSSTTSRSMFANVSSQQPASPASTTTMQLSTKRPSVLVDDATGGNAGGGVAGATIVSLQDDYLLLAELFSSGLEFHTWKSEHESELSKHIKLFEPLVIYCLTLFLKCNGRVQSNILELLVLLLDLNVTYSILDSKNVIFDNIIKSLDIIESGIARNGLFMITPIIKFLIKLSSKSERNLITIPKIISITNNLLANNNIRDVAVQALKTLAYEIFLMTSTLSQQQQNTTSSSDIQTQASSLTTTGTAAASASSQKHLLDDPNSLAAITENLLTLNNELDTQKEVILGMLEKFIESNDCQQVLSLLLLIEQLQQQRQQQHQHQMLFNDANNTTKENSTTLTSMVDNSCGSDAAGVSGSSMKEKQQQQQHRPHTTCLPNLDTVCNMICQSICSNRLYIQDWNDFYMLDTFFKNNSKYLLGNSKEFTALLKYIIEGDVTNFSDLSYATIILSNVILKTEEIYLVNHIKLYLKNHPTIVEKLRQKQQQKIKQQQQQTANPTGAAAAGSTDDASHWQMDSSSGTMWNDQPSTSKLAAAQAAAFTAALQQTSNSSSVINEINYFATVLCDVLLDCFRTILSDHRQQHSCSSLSTSTTTSSSYSHSFTIQYCRLVCHFVKVFHKLCFNSRLEDSSLFASIRFTLNACESKLLNEYYNLLMMYSTQGCSTTTTTATSSLPEYDDDNIVLQLQIEMFHLLNAFGILDTITLLQRLQLDDISNHVRRAMLEKVCHQSNPNPIEWNLQQVQHLFHGNFLNILIIEQFAFMCNLCEVDEEFCSLFQTMVLKNIKVLNKHSIVYLLRLVEYLCKERVDSSILCFAKFLQILNKLHKILAATAATSSTSSRPLQLQIERLARHLIVDASSMHDKNAIYDTFIHLTEEEEDQEDEVEKEGEQQQSLDVAGISSSSYLSQQLLFIILNDLENSCEIRDDDINAPPLGNVSNIVDEKWIFNQLIKFSAQNNYDPQQIVKILLEIQSENKLQKIFNNGNFDATRILRHSITSSLSAMLQTFRNNCIQYNPHIHYMRPNPLARVSLAQLMTRIAEIMRRQQQQQPALKGVLHESNDRQQQQNNENDDINKQQKQQQQQHQATVVKGTSTADDRNNISCIVVSDDDEDVVIAAAGSSGGIGNVVVGGVTNNDNILLSITTSRGSCSAINATITTNTTIHLCEAVIALIENIKQIEVTALIYIESKFIDKFLSEHLLRPEHVITLVRFIGWCCQYIKAIFNGPPSTSLTHEQRNCVTIALQCIDILLHQKFIWYALNQQQTFVKAMPTTTAAATAAAGGGAGVGVASLAGIGTGSVAASSGTSDTIDSCSPLTKCELNKIICSLLDVVVMSASILLENTIFYRKYKNALRRSSTTPATTTSNQQHHHQHHDEQNQEQQKTFENEAWLTAEYNPKAIFLGKLIETKIGNYDKGICFGEYSATSFPSSSSASASSTTAAGASTSFGLSNIDVLDLKGINNQFDFISLHVLLSISISSLRFNLFYSVAVTPYEIIQQQQRLQACQSATTSPTTSPSHKSQSGKTSTATTTSNSMLPIIPIESLSDVDILKSFVKRLSIFGFTTRQQFEEYFMTFLLLINKVYDENMVDQQEQFQIRSICLEAIMELLITYKTFPIVGNKLSLYHHTTRWNRINCDSISLKKLHEIQLIISPTNVFYHSNLERNLIYDSVIGTQYFSSNQFDLNFIWQQMENSSSSQNPSIDESDSSSSMTGGDEQNTSKTSSSSAALTPKTKHLNGVAANTAYRNYQYFTKQSGVDYKSSSQLIFDVLMQMIEQNHILILPNLVKFTEICENREQIKQIWEKADYLKTHIPMDDTISHQHLIYLLCKTKGMLIPSHLEMLNLEALIKNYLKSSHLFVRCAALNGLLSLLESYAKTNTTIGKLSDELVRLKDIVLAYIDKHGLIEESPLQCSDVHTKLIWTLNYCLMEWTSKLDAQCNVAYHTKLSVTKLLKNSSNEQVYLCCLHGLERMIVLDNKVCNGSGGSNSNNSADNQNQMLRPCIEKLALELAKLENEKFSIPALKLLLSCIYVGSSKQLENTELSNGIVQDDPEIIAQQTDKVDILLQCIKTATKEAAWIYGQVLCQMIRDLVPPKEILTKVIKEFLAINQPHSDVIAMIVFQVFRSAIDSSFLQQLQDWLTCSLPTFLSLPEQKAVWSLSVVFLSASINLHLMKLFPLLLNGITPASATVTAAATTPTPTPTSSASTLTSTIRMNSEKLGHHEIALFVTSAQDFYAKLGNEQKVRFREAFKEFHHIKVYNKMLQSL